MDTIPLAMPADLLDEVKRTAVQTHLSNADVMRQAIKAGLPQVREALAVKESEPILEGIKPLSHEVLERVCKERRENEGLEDLEMMLKSQAPKE